MCCGVPVNNTAGPVEYNKDGFCNANKDALIHDLLCVVKASRNKFVQALYPEPLDAEKKVVSLKYDRAVVCFCEHYIVLVEPLAKERGA
jgi:myosin heavy subunit